MNLPMLLLFDLDQREQERRRKLVMFRRLKLEKKKLRDCSNPFTMYPEFFRQFYRMPPAVALDLVHLLHDRIIMQGSSHIPVHLQVLAALRFFAEGSYQKAVINDYKHPMGRSTFIRCLNRVVVSLSLIADDWIKFPETKEERQLVSNQFRQCNRIPNILGLIDCVVVKCIRPPSNEEAFFHHKHSHSMNVQIVCDANHIIQSIRICPGSNNDKNIWRFSDVREKLIALRHDHDIVQEEGYYYFLGDSGYTPSPIMLTPVINAQEGSAAACYTTEHVKTRCRVEQTFGKLSNVWQCVSRRRVLYYKPKKVALIIQASAVLHNFRIRHGVYDDGREHDIPLLNHTFNNQEIDCQEGDFQAGIRERTRLIVRYYLHN